MQDTHHPESFAEAFGRALQESQTSVRRLSRLSGIPRRTLENWLHGQTRAPRHWEPVLIVAQALHLPPNQVDALLHAAGLPLLTALHSTRDGERSADVLSFWTFPPEVPAGQLSPLLAQNLPVMTTPILGREAPLEYLSSLLRQSEVRLMTVVGLGGVGKTRLAIEVVHAVEGLFQGVVFVPLQTVRTAAGLWDQILTSLHMPRDPNIPVERLVLDLLRNRKMLLVLDNFEHLLALTPQIALLLEQTLQLKLLITSRHALDLRAEYVVPISGLSTEGGAVSPAYQVFMQAARRRIPEYEPTAIEVQDILAICKAMEGLPLALELTASWLEVMRPERILTQLQSGLAWISHPTADRPHRQHSIWNVFDYSFKTLSPEEQHAAMRLSVFQGSFGAAAALAVGQCQPETLRRLLHSSLLQRTADGRLIYHSLVRQFVAEQAERAGQDARALESSFSDYTMVWLAEQAGELRRTMSVRPVARLMAEWHNVDRAWWLAVRDSRYDLLDQAIDLLIYFESRGMWAEGRDFFRSTREQIPVEFRRIRARLDEAEAILALRLFDFESAFPLAQGALNVFAELGVDPMTDPAGAYARMVVWAVSYSLGQFDDAPDVMAQARSVAGDYLAMFGEMNYLLLRGVRLTTKGQHAAAAAVFREAIETCGPDGYHLPNVRIFLGMLSSHTGDIDVAREQFRLALDRGMKTGVYPAVVVSSFELSLLETDAPAPEVGLQSLIDLSARTGTPGTTGRIALHLAVVYLTLGFFQRAGWMAWASVRLLEEAGPYTERAQAMANLGQAFLTFGQVQGAHALLSAAHAQPDTDPALQARISGLLAMLGGPLGSTSDDELAQVLYSGLSGG